MQRLGQRFCAPKLATLLRPSVTTKGMPTGMTTGMTTGMATGMAATMAN